MTVEKRKRNIIVFNLPATSSKETDRVAALFEHLIGTVSPTFLCYRIGKPKAEKAQPLLVQFVSEFECVDILHSAHKLTCKQNGLVWESPLTGQSSNKSVIIINEICAKRLCSQQRSKPHVLLLSSTMPDLGK